MPINQTKFAHKSFTIPAGGEVEFALPSAASAYFYAQSGSFEIGLDGGQMMPWSKGKAFRLPELETIERIKLRDTSGAENTVKAYFGNVEILDATLQVLNAEDLLTKRPDAAEQIFDATIAAAAAEAILHVSDTATAEILVHNYGANPAEIRNGASELIDELAAGEKARYIVTAGLNVYSALGTDLRAARFFF